MSTKNPSRCQQKIAMIDVDHKPQTTTSKKQPRQTLIEIKPQLTCAKSNLDRCRLKNFISRHQLKKTQRHWKKQFPPKSAEKIQLNSSEKQRQSVSVKKKSGQHQPKGNLDQSWLKKKSLLQRLLKMPRNTRLKPYTTRMAKIQGLNEGKKNLF